MTDEPEDLVHPDVPPDRVALIRIAFTAMRVLTEDERRGVLCWFCEGCYRYVGPGDECYCLRDRDTLD